MKSIIKVSNFWQFINLAYFQIWFISIYELNQKQCRGNKIQLIEKSFKLSFCVFNIVCFSLKATVDSVSSNSRRAFLKAVKSLWLSEISLDFSLIDLRSIKLDNCRSHFFTLLLNFKFMLLVYIVNVNLFIFVGALFVVRESRVGRFERSLFHFDFLQVFEVILLLFDLFRNVSVRDIVISDRNIAWIKQKKYLLQFRNSFCQWKIWNCWLFLWSGRTLFSYFHLLRHFLCTGTCPGPHHQVLI